MTEPILSTAIPPEFIRNWQSSHYRSAKSVKRRPKTACEPCRIARVKCDSKGSCQRCTSRGIQCHYATPESTTAAESQNLDSSRQKARNNRKGSTAHAKTIPPTQSLDPPPIHGGGDHDGQLCVDDLAFESMIGSVMPSSVNMYHSRMQELDSAAMELGHDIFSPPGSTSPLDCNFMQPQLNKPPFASTQMTPMISQEDPHGQTSQCSRKTHFASIPHDAGPAAEPCACRLQLAMLSPVIDKATQSGRLDEVFKTTSDIIKRAKDIIDCTSCQVSYTDLLCIMAIFQQTSTCWEQISEADFFGDIKVSVGNYQIPLANNAEVRCVLVADLMEQARVLLDSLQRDSINIRTHSSVRLRQLNLGYLQACIEHFRVILGLATNALEEESSGSEI